MRVLLIGGTGTIGQAIQQKMKTDMTLFAPTSDAVNIVNYSQVQKCITVVKPQVVINTAVLGVDLSEQNPQLAEQVNHLGAENLAKVCAIFHIPLIHLSTDYVFSGTQKKPYCETDEALPVNMYGKTKLLGEKSVMNHLEKHIIFRTSWVFGEYGYSFMNMILSLAKTNSTINVVEDEVSCPTFVNAIAETLQIISKKILRGFNEWGIYHYCGNEAISRYNYALEILNIAKNHTELKVNTVKPILAKEFASNVNRPHYSAMSCEKIQKTFEIPSSEWRIALKKFLSTANMTI